MTDEEKLRLGYEEALKQLRLHPGLFWTRSNFFLLIQSGLLAFTLNLATHPGKQNRVMAGIAGLLVAVGWLWVNVIGRKLQREWRDIASKIEVELFTPGIKEQEIPGPFQLAWLRGEGQNRKLSLTLPIIWLSIGFIVLWILLLLQTFLQ
jgi:hypothetical protein